MKKTRKFISIFAILFAIVLALSVCFFAACKGGSDDGGNSGDTGTQQGDDTGSGSGDGSGSGSSTDGSGSGSGTEGGSESGSGQTVTKVVYLATSSDVQYTTAGDAVFTNESDLEITTSDGLTYTVSGTASTMGEAEAEWYATDDVEEGTPYVVIKIAVAGGESIYFENSEKTYTNDEAGKGDFDEGYMFIVCKLSFDDEGVCTSETSYTITATDGTTKTTYKVSFSGVTLPADDVELEEIASWNFSDTTKFGSSSIDTTVPTVATENVGTTTITETTDGVATPKTVYYIATEVKYADGTSTGLTCMQSSEKQTKIDTGNNTQRVNFGGGIFTYQSCLIYSLEAGTFTISMSYCSGTNDQKYAGRYATIINSAGTRLIGDAPSEYQTDSNGTVITRTVTITLTEAGDIYFGSASSGLYLTGITICK